MSTVGETEREHVRDEERAAPQIQSDADVRRARASTRIPFDGVVEIGAELGPPFEAQAVDVSGTGMHLRTAYLPEVGQTLSCRFEAGRESVIATGEVVWQKEAGRGGEFGLRFIDLDQESALALERMTDRARLNVPGAKVRLHIEGLGAPMRARVKNAANAEVKVGSELGFLRVGKQIDLEDAESGNRRPASIDRVDVEIDPSSRIPQLVVALKYDDIEEPAVAPEAQIPQAAPVRGSSPKMSAHPSGHAFEVMNSSSAQASGAAHDELDQDEIDVPISNPMPMADAGGFGRNAAKERDDAQDYEDSMSLKGPVARAASKVTPALENFAKRTKTTAMLLLEKAKSARSRDRDRESESSPIRRTTAPAPGGGLHTAGRKVVRGEAPAFVEKVAESKMVGLMSNKKRMTMMGAGAIAVLAVGVALVAKKPAEPPAAPSETATTAPLAADPNQPATPLPGAPGAAPLTTAASPTMLGAAPAPATAAPSTVEVASGSSANQGSGSMASDSSESVGDTEPHHAKKVAIKVTPFTNGGITRGNLLRLKMDGAIDKIQGASQPTGFTVHIPGRRSLEPAAPLAARDGRIGSIKVVNDPTGAELAVTFKDGVPNYTVRAKGDQLEIVLATPSSANNLAAKDDGEDAKPAQVHKKTASKRSHHKHSKH